MNGVWAPPSSLWPEQLETAGRSTSFTRPGDSPLRRQATVGSVKRCASVRAWSAVMGAPMNTGLRKVRSVLKVTQLATEPGFDVTSF